MMMTSNEMSSISPIEAQKISNVYSRFRYTNARLDINESKDVKYQFKSLKQLNLASLNDLVDELIKEENKRSWLIYTDGLDCLADKLSLFLKDNFKERKYCEIKVAKEIEELNINRRQLVDVYSLNERIIDGIVCPSVHGLEKIFSDKEILFTFTQLVHALKLRHIYKEGSFGMMFGNTKCESVINYIYKACYDYEVFLRSKGVLINEPLLVDRTSMCDYFDIEKFDPSDDRDNKNFYTTALGTAIVF